MFNSGSAGGGTVIISMGNENKTNNTDKKFAVDKTGLWLMLAGLVVLFAGFALLSGGGVKDPQVFNYDMFDFRRLVVAPLVMVCGIIIETYAIMRGHKSQREE